MKYIKSILALTLGVAMAFTASSCQLSKLIPEKTDDPAASTDPLTTFTLSQVAETTNLLTADMTKYVTLGNYKGLTATETVTPLTDEAFAAELNSYLNSVTVYEKITDRKTQENDTLIMDYVGTLDGVAFMGGTAQGRSITLTENSGYIAGFAEGLIGVTPGQTVALNLTFPTDYHAADLAGKAVVFTVTVHYIQGEKITPELTDAFITAYTDGEFTSIDAFSTFYRTYLEESAIEEAHTAAVNSLWSQVFENSTFHELPADRVDYYFAQVKAQYESYGATYGMTYESILAAFGITEDSLRRQAEQYVKQDLVFYAIVQAEGLTITESEYDTHILEYVEGSGVGVAEFEAYYGRDKLIESMLWDEMIEIIYSSAVITK